MGWRLETPRQEREGEESPKSEQALQPPAQFGAPSEGWYLSFEEVKETWWAPGGGAQRLWRAGQAAVMSNGVRCPRACVRFFTPLPSPPSSPHPPSVLALRVSSPQGCLVLRCRVKPTFPSSRCFQIPNM